MRLSAIIPVLNEAARIEDALRGLAPEVDERIVVDGGSEDGTADLASQVPGVRVLQAPRGRGPQLNAGAEVATGDVLWFVHADVRPPAGARVHIARALATPEVVAGAFVTRTRADGPSSWVTPLLPMADLRSHYTRRPYGDQAVFVRADTFWSVGGFPDQPLMEDLELARRLSRRGRVARVRRPVEVSGRRFLARPLYFALVMNTFPMLYRAGVGPDALARLYGHVRQAGWRPGGES